MVHHGFIMVSSFPPSYSDIYICVYGQMCSMKRYDRVVCLFQMNIINVWFQMRTHGVVHPSPTLATNCQNANQVCISQGHDHGACVLCVMCALCARETKERAKLASNSQSHAVLNHRFSCPAIFYRCAPGLRKLRGVAESFPKRHSP